MLDQWPSFFNVFAHYDEGTVSQYAAEHVAEMVETHELLVRALQSLDIRYQYVLCHRYGLFGQPFKTLGELGKDMKRSEATVQKIQLQAERQLRLEWEELLRPANPLRPKPQAPTREGKRPPPQSKVVHKRRKDGVIFCRPNISADESARRGTWGVGFSQRLGTCELQVVFAGIARNSRAEEGCCSSKRFQQSIRLWCWVR